LDVEKDRREVVVQKLLQGFHAGVRHHHLLTQRFEDRGQCDQVCRAVVHEEELSRAGIGRAVLPIFWFVFKVLCFLFLFIWVRGTLPRFRYDQLMSFGWKFLLPLAMANILITALVLAVHG